MAKNPLILALSNPMPEIMPELAMEARPDAMVCTGRSDYPNQVNNVLCFPFLFRGALDVGATTINEEMKIAAVHAIAKLAHEPALEASASGGGTIFGRDYLIPNPFDQRLILRIAPAVAQAAMDSGVARRPIEDFGAYRDSLNRFVFRSGLVMKPIIEQAQTAKKRVAFADGEDERVLRATQVLLEEGMVHPILIGRPAVIEQRIERFGLTLSPGKDFEIINPEDDPRYRDYVSLFHSLVGRSGVTPDTARTIVRTNTTVIGALAVKRGEADGLLCGLQGRFIKHARDIKSVIGLAEGVSDISALSMLIMQQGAFFLADTYMHHRPDARGDRFDHPAGTGASAALQYRGQGGASQLFEFRFARRRHRLQDAGGLPDAEVAGARSDRRRRDAGRSGAEREAEGALYPRQRA